MTRKRKPVSPGEMLAEEFLKPLSMSNYRLAKEIGVPAQRIGEIVAGKLFFCMELRFWLNLQSEYDIRVANRELRAKLSPRIRVFQPG